MTRLRSPMFRFLFVLMLLIIFWGNSEQTTQSRSSSFTDADQQANIPESEKQTFDCTSVNDIPQIECEALVAIYQSTYSSTWEGLGSWLILDSPCKWYGVGCEEGVVTSLDLNDFELNGQLPAELGNLLNLRKFDAFNNRMLAGEIPPELGNLIKLESLTLFSTSLEGSIPESIGNLSRLSSLDLSHSNLNGTIPASLGNLSKLELLNLSSNSLSGSIPPTLGNLSNLESMFILNNNLTGSIPPELAQLSSLKYLNLLNNEISGEIPPELAELDNLLALILTRTKLSGEIPPELGTMTNLQQLALGGNELTGSVPRELGNLAQLQALHLSLNKLSGEIPEELSRLSGLFSLDLRYNDFSGKIPLQFMKLEKLTRFKFLGTQLCEPVQPEFQSWIYEREVIGTDRLCDGTYKKFPTPTVPEFDCMTVSQIPQNECDALVALFMQTDGVRWKRQGGWLRTDEPCNGWYGINCEDGHVQNMNLSSNGLNGIIPSQFGALSDLKHVDLSSNSLRGGLPSEIGNLRELQWLYLASNDLSGTLPSTLGQLAQLTFLNIRRNELTGPIPAELGKLIQLETLDLSQNALVRNLPSAFSNLKNLEFLNLGDNNLSGEIPAELTLLTTLKEFEFDFTDVCKPNNQPFQEWLDNLEVASNAPYCDDTLNPSYDCTSIGTIPYAECQALVLLYQKTNGVQWKNQENWLKSDNPCTWHGITCANGHVRAMDMSLKELTGYLPSAIGQLSFLELLDLTSNDLRWETPSGIDGLVNLEELQLIWGSWTRIPPEIDKLQNLKELNIATSFVTSIPPEIGNLVNLQNLGLSSNPLEGPLPKELTNLKQLRRLFIGSTNLCEPPERSFQEWMRGVQVFSPRGLCNVRELRPVSYLPLVTN